MLACVVDCSQICRARSTSRKTGCEGKLWPAAKECDQDVTLIRAFSDTVGYSEGSCTPRSESWQCLDGAYEKSDCISAGQNHPEFEDEVVENDTGNEEHSQEEQGGEEDHSRVTDKDHDRRLGEEAEVEETKPGLQLYSETGGSYRVSNSDFKTRMPAKSTEGLQISSRGRQLEPGEQTLRRRTETPIGVVSTELGPSVSVRFGEGFESVHNINKGGGTGKEPQLAEGRGRPHELFAERLDIVGSRRDERSGTVQLRPSSSWGDDLRGSQEHLSFQGEDTVECITNVGEEDDFGFDVDEFHTSHHGQKHEEPIQETERLSEFHTRGDSSQRDQGKQSSPSSTFESPQIQNETSLKTGADSRQQSSVKESKEGSHLPPVDPTTGGRKIGAGAGRVGKGQEKDLRGEGNLRKSEASTVSDERRVRARLEGPAPSTGRGDETEEASTKIVRPSRSSGGKDRHSKVNTAKGPRDRRVRLSVPTAVQFYDVQDRLGYDQPSKAVEWLIKKAKAAIDELGRLPARGNDGPSTLSDTTHASPYSASLGGPVSGSSSCPPAGSFSNSPFVVDHNENHISYFIDSSPQQGVSFGDHPVHGRDVTRGLDLSQGHLVNRQGQLASLSFPLGQTDLSRGNLGCIDGGKPGEFPGRVESRFKARERARERAKEKGTGRDCGKGNGSGSSPPSLQSPPLDQNPIHSSFPAQNAMQSSVHSLSLQNPHRSSFQSSLSGSVFDTTLSGIMQSCQQGSLQNLIMHDPSLQSPLMDQVQSSLHHQFQGHLHSTLQLNSQSITSLQNPGMQQQPHLQRSSLEGNTQRALHLGSGFTPGPCDASSFSDGASLNSSDFMSISPIPISHSLSMSELSSFGITSPSAMGPHFPTGSSAGQIPLGFSPGPPASAFRPRSTSISQSGSKESQPHLQSLSRPQCQLILPSYSNAHGLASPGGSTSSKASTSLYYPQTPSRMGSLQSLSRAQLESSSYSSIRNVGYDYQRLHMMSPGQGSGSFQASNSQLQMPARLQGLDDFDEDLKSSPPPSPHEHP